MLEPDVQDQTTAVVVYPGSENLLFASPGHPGIHKSPELAFGQQSQANALKFRLFFFQTEEYQGDKNAKQNDGPNAEIYCVISSSDEELFSQQSKKTKQPQGNNTKNNKEAWFYDNNFYSKESLNTVFIAAVATKTSVKMWSLHLVNKPFFTARPGDISNVTSGFVHKFPYSYGLLSEPEKDYQVREIFWRTEFDCCLINIISDRPGLLL